MLRVRVHSIQDREHNIFHVRIYRAEFDADTNVNICSIFQEGFSAFSKHCFFYHVAIVRVLLSLVHIHGKMSFFNRSKVGISGHLLDGKSSFVDYTCQLQLNFHI